MGLTRVELVTSRLSAVRSNQLSYRPFRDTREEKEGSSRAKKCPTDKVGFLL